MSAVLDRALNILECLAHNPAGLQLYVIAEQLGIPRSATHRLLADLALLGYVEQDSIAETYRLTLKVSSLGQTFLSLNGVLDIAQPILDTLAERVGELVRLSIVSNERLTWVAKAQGARNGFRYDPDAGAEAHLASTSSGHAWLSTMSEEEAVRLVSRQGFGDPRQLGPHAIRTVQTLLQRLKDVRQAGYALVVESSAPGLSAVSTPVRTRDGTRVIGVLSVAGPTIRLPENKLRDIIVADLLAAASKLSAASLGSAYFGGVWRLGQGAAEPHDAP